MRSFSKFVIGVVVAGAALSASAASYSSLVVFGDSLSDSGNAYLAINSSLPSGATFPQQSITGNSFVPSVPYIVGTSSASSLPTFSNGPVWATQFATLLGMGLTPSLTGGTNYAFGGATTGTGATSLLNQTASYLTTTSNHASSTALYVVAGGGNDIRATLGSLAGVSDPSTFNSIVGAAAVQYATNIGSIVSSLKSAGAQNIVVWNAPNLGLAPAVTSQGPAASFAGSAVSAAFNSALASLNLSAAGVSTFDLFSLGTTAASKGFNQLSDACGAASNSGVCPDLSKALFWDGIHPTTAAQGLIASEMYTLVAAPVPEPETWMMLLVGLGLMGAAARRRQASV